MPRSRPARAMKKSQAPKRAPKKDGLPEGAERLVVSPREFARFAQAMEAQSAAAGRVNELADMMCAARDIDHAQVLGIDPDAQALIIRRAKPAPAAPPAEAPKE